MAELFIELLREEIPSKLQTDARKKIKNIIEENLKKREINFLTSKSFSLPKRLVFVIDGLPKKIEYKKKVIKGPKIEAPKSALDGFLKSNELNQKDVYKKKIEKGIFYFAETKPKPIDILEELKIIIPESLQAYSWKKSMKWSTYELKWGRPLKSIIAVFNHKVINFKFFHIESDNTTLIEGKKKDVIKKIKNFATYTKLLKNQDIILDQLERKNIIIKKMNSICNSKNLRNSFNEKLIDEVVNLVEKPNVIICRFNDIYLKIPQEILIVTMQHHQKYFPLFDRKENLTNLFLLVSNLQDKKGYIKTGNQRVIEARLSDAKFFWDKNKTQGLVKEIKKLKNLSFFNNLGTLYDKTQRMKKLASPISDQLNYNKEKIEIASSICKSDLTSDLVGEFPELQGVMGKYFANEQGFDQDISNAICDHYLPTGINSAVPKKPVSIAVAVIDKIDTLVGFFGVNEKPTSSKDPFALRRTAIGLLRIIIENKLSFQLKDLINYSIILYEEQNKKFVNESTVKEVLFFLKERFKNILKEKNIRSDIIEAIDDSHINYDFLSVYKKCKIINKNISREMFKNIVSIYKRASNIIYDERKDNKFEIFEQPESSLFKKDEEKILFDKIREIRNYFSTTIKAENYEDTLKMLAGAKPAMDNFFDNVIVNDENIDIKKNRLSLIKMFCNTCNNFIDFSKIEGA